MRSLKSWAVTSKMAFLNLNTRDPYGNDYVSRKQLNGFDNKELSQAGYQTGYAWHFQGTTGRPQIALLAAVEVNILNEAAPRMISNSPRMLILR